MKYKFYGNISMSGGVVIDANNEQEAREKACRGVFNEFNITDDQSHIEFVWDMEDPELISGNEIQLVCQRIDSFIQHGVEQNNIDVAKKIWSYLFNRYCLPVPRIMSADTEITMVLELNQHHLEIEIVDGIIEYFYTDKNTDFYLGEDSEDYTNVPEKIHDMIVKSFGEKRK